MGDPDGRHAEDGAKVKGKARSAHVVAPGGVDEQHVGSHLEGADRGLEARSLAQREQARDVRSPGSAADGDLGEDARVPQHGGSRPGRVAA